MRQTIRTLIGDYEVVLPDCDNETPAALIAMLKHEFFINPALIGEFRLALTDNFNFRFSNPNAPTDVLNAEFHEVLRAVSNAAPAIKIMNHLVDYILGDRRLDTPDITHILITRPAPTLNEFNDKEETN